MPEYLLTCRACGETETIYAHHTMKGLFVCQKCDTKMDCEELVFPCLP